MTNNRPRIITAICIIGFIGALVTVPFIFSDTSEQIGPWYPPYLAFGAIVGLVLHDWPMDDEKMEHHRLTQTLFWYQSSGVTRDGCLEYFCSHHSGNCDCYRVFKI